ncbi:hypothetical protein [Paenibacillus aquistagni]|uniref:hypothetical protein n=1 Tax=Paenibacillus aquistagni TaxID=1852522 RepID=UPI001F101024|nr:hypothetical protein [Paenibacillus aquistagni]
MNLLVREHPQRVSIAGETYAKYGENGLLEERRGIGSTGRRSKSESSAEEKLKLGINSLKRRMNF